jgi:hypothetical protein
MLNPIVIGGPVGVPAKAAPPVARIIANTAAARAIFLDILPLHCEVARQA